MVIAAISRVIYATGQAEYRAGGANRGENMVYYVAHEYGGRIDNYNRAMAITKKLQLNDMANTYLCPLMALSHLSYDDTTHEEAMELCFDLLMLCDALIVASDESDGVDQEITMAEKLGMEVIYLARDI